MSEIINKNNTQIWSVGKWLFTVENIFCLQDCSGKYQHLNEFLNLLHNNMSDFMSQFTDSLSSSPKKTKALLLQLISTSNKIFLSFNRLNRIELSLDQVSIIRSAYIKMLNLIESILADCEKLKQSLLISLPLTKYDFFYRRTYLKSKLAKVRLVLQNSDIDIELSSLVVNKIQNALISPDATRGEIYFISLLMKNFLRSSNLHNDNIVLFLIQHNFNDAEFLNYCTEIYNRTIIDYSCLHSQIEIIISIEERLKYFQPITKWKFNMAEDPMHEQLGYYFHVKKDSLNQKLEIRRAQTEDGKLLEANDKIETHMSVAELSLLIKLFMEHDMLPKKNTGKMFTLFAKNFTTRRSQFISPDSLQKKASTVEFATAKKVKGLLLTMVNWINKYYNTADYSG